MSKYALGMPTLIELAMDGDCIGLTWDVGHDAESGFSEQGTFEELRGRIRHMHIHDWDGGGAHQVLFSGKVDMAAMVALAKRLDVRVVIETKTTESLAESARRLEKCGAR